MTVAIANVAQERAERIRAGLEQLAPDILAAWEARDWVALGYSSWNEYVIGEFGGPLKLGREERRDVVAGMRQSGMSTPAIASALGISKATAWRDATSPNVEVPAVITGTDGVDRPATVPRAIGPGVDVVGPIWIHLVATLYGLDAVLSSGASVIADAVPKRRRAATARKLRKLGTGMGRVAWTLEGMESPK
jgi:hypothetical protein